MCFITTAIDSEKSIHCEKKFKSLFSMSLLPTEDVVILLFLRLHGKNGLKCMDLTQMLIVVVVNDCCYLKKLSNNFFLRQEAQNSQSTFLNIDTSFRRIRDSTLFVIRYLRCFSTSFPQRLFSNFS